jgi:AAA+ ATPase superfamily predicted ATPase
LSGLLTAVREERHSGKAILIRGRRRIGKSRLVVEFVEQAGVAYVFFTASKAPNEPQLFVEEVLSSNLPGREHFMDVRLSTWDAAFRLLVTTLSQDSPSIIIVDDCRT